MIYDLLTVLLNGFSFYFRGENGPGCFILTQLANDKCEIKWLMSLDIKGWIPQTIVDASCTSVMLNYVEELRKFVDATKMIGVSTITLPKVDLDPNHPIYIGQSNLNDSSDKNNFSDGLVQLNPSVLNKKISSDPSVSVVVNEMATGSNSSNDETINNLDNANKPLIEF